MVYGTLYVSFNPYVPGLIYTFVESVLVLRREIKSGFNTIILTQLENKPLFRLMKRSRSHPSPTVEGDSQEKWIISCSGKDEINGLSFLQSKNEIGVECVGVMNNSDN